MERRKRKNGTQTYLVRWIDAKTGERKNQRCSLEEDAKFLLAVLEAHGSDTEKALKSAIDHYSGIYTVKRMVEDHIELLTSANGYTLRRYKGQLRCHIADSIGLSDATRVEYRDIVSWIRQLQSKDLSAKTIANVHGLLSAAFNSMVRERRRSDNPCKGISLPKAEDTEEVASFLTREEWQLIRSQLEEPYRTFFSFLIATGLRFSEATALHARDFTSTANGRASVKIVRAWTRDEENQLRIGPTKTRQSRRTVALNEETHRMIKGLLDASARSGQSVFLNSEGNTIDHRRAWGVWDRAVRKAQELGLIKKPRIHDLRHSNASWLLQAGLDIYKLQKHLGHRSITTTLDRYSHLLPEGVTATADAIDRAFGAGAV